jgi:hypothetical protein
VTGDAETLKFLTEAAEHYNYALRGAKARQGDAERRRDGDRRSL